MNGFETNQAGRRAAFSALAVCRAFCTPNTGILCGCVFKGGMKHQRAPWLTAYVGLAQRLLLNGD